MNQVSVDNNREKGPSQAPLEAFFNMLVLFFWSILSGGFLSLRTQLLTGSSLKASRGTIKICIDSSRKIRRVLLFLDF